MKKPLPNPDFLPNKEELIQKSIASLRTSFEIEGIYFTDEQFEAMISKVLKERKERGVFPLKMRYNG